MPTPFPTQLAGAQFLAQRPAALLADMPRCGKTGAAIIAADLVLAERLLVVTTASGRGVWLKGLRDWSVYDRKPQILLSATKRASDTLIVGWPSLANPAVRAALLAEWDAVVLDEAHFAKSHEAKRTQAAYGDFRAGGADLVKATGVTGKAARVWPLTGTPIPHSAGDLYPMLRALCPERLAARGDWPDVTKQQDFLHRYCVVKMKKLSNFNRIPVVVGSRNLDELRARLDGFMLRRTQEDVGIRAPIYDLLPLVVSPKMVREADGDLKAEAIVAAAADGDTRSLEMHLGPLRRLTGEIKARAVVDAVIDEFEGGLDKIVLMHWHKDVGAILREGLAKYGVSGIDGSSSATERTAAVERFQTGDARVFVGQIQAAGEAIDLSAASVLWFCEVSFSPKDMAQAALRITNFEQKRQAFVKVVTLQGSIDEVIQSRLMMLWAGIKEVLAK